MTFRQDLCSAGFTGEQAEAILRIMNQASVNQLAEIKKAIVRASKIIVLSAVGIAAFQAAVLIGYANRFIFSRGDFFVDSLDLFHEGFLIPVFPVFA